MHQRNPSIINNISLNKSERHHTYTSIDDQISAIMHQFIQPQPHSNNNSNKSNIIKWLLKVQDSVTKPTNLYIIPDKAPTFYMISINSVGPINYKKAAPDNKLFLKLVMNLYDGVNDEYLSRTVTTQGYQVLQYDNKDSGYIQEQRISLYFYTYRSSRLFLKIQCQVYESMTLPSRKQVIVNCTRLGLMKLDINKLSRTKQKQHLFSIDFPNLDGRIETTIQYLITISDSYKILEKVIPCDCLVSSEDHISGIMGAQLPNNQFVKIEYVELLSLKIQFQDITIPTKALTQINKISSTIFNGLYPNFKITSSSIKEYRIYAHFHNGWQIVNTSSILIKQRMQVQKKKDSKGIQEIITITKFNSDEVLALPFIFLGQDCMLVLEASCKVQVKGQINETITKLNPIEKVEIIDIPLGSVYHSMSGYSKPQEKHVMALMNSKNIYNISTSNEGRMQWGQSDSQTSPIQYYLHMEGINKLQFSQHLKPGIVNEKDKVQLEKERIMRENERIKNESRKRKIELNKELPIVDANDIRENAYVKSLEELKKETSQKQQMLLFLREKYAQQLKSHEKNQHILPLNQDPFYNKKNIKNHYDAQYVQAYLKEIPQSKIYIYTPRYPSIKQLQKTPLEIIKTQLQQSHYSYLFFISLVTLTPINYQTLLPRKLYINIGVFIEQLTTINLKVNQLTGEIIVAKEQKISKQEKIEKVNKQVMNKKKKITFKQKTQNNLENILDVEISPVKAYNSQSHFIKFINYLYNGFLTLQIIDADKNIPFAHTYFPLRQLIRKRRNQVIHTQECILFQNTYPKGKLKLSVRTLRKEPQIQSEPTAPFKQESSQSRQIERINRYKSTINKQYSTKVQTISRIMEQSYLQKDLILLVSRMQSQFIFLQIQNKNNFECVYKASISDPHEPYLQYSQANFVTNIKKINTNLVNIPANIKILSLNSDITIDANSKLSIPIQYKTDRKYYSQLHNQNPSLLMYNVPHEIIVSFININTNKVVSLHRILIRPIPQYNSITICLFRRKNNITKLCLPCLIPSHQKYKVFIDDSTAITQLNENNQIILDCMVGNINMCRQINISVYDESIQSVLRNIKVELWGADQYVIEGVLWKQIQTILDVPPLIFSHQVSDVFIFADDEKVISLREKNPFRLTNSKTQAYARISVTPNIIGTAYHQLVLSHPITKAILHRYVLKVQTHNTPIKQYCILNIRKTDQMLNEPFTYTNPLTRKAVFKILSTKQHLVWAASQTVQIDAKSDKKIMIEINAAEIQEGQSVVIGFKNDLLLEYYMFTFKKH